MAKQSLLKGLKDAASQVKERITAPKSVRQLEDAQIDGAYAMIQWPILDRDASRYADVRRQAFALMAKGEFHGDLHGGFAKEGDMVATPADWIARPYAMAHNLMVKLARFRIAPAVAINYTHEYAQSCGVQLEKGELWAKIKPPTTWTMIPDSVPSLAAPEERQSIYAQGWRQKVNDEAMKAMQSPEAELKNYGKSALEAAAAGQGRMSDL